MNQGWVGGSHSLECLTKAGRAGYAAEAVCCFCVVLILFHFTGHPGCPSNGSSCG